MAVALELEEAQEVVIIRVTLREESLAVPTKQVLTEIDDGGVEVEIVAIAASVVDRQRAVKGVQEDISVYL